MNKISAKPASKPVSKPGTTPGSKQKAGPAQVVTRILETYAAKALFRGFSAHPDASGNAIYRMLWHHDRRFELLLDAEKKILQFPEVLPGVPARSAMYRELKAFLKVRQSGEMPEHRSINPAKARLATGNQRGTVSLTLTVKDGDFDYAARKIIHIVHEIFLIFLVDGPYFEYMVQHLGLDEDRY